MINKQPSIECVWPAEAILGESPYWCSEEQMLYWVDIDGKTVMSFDPATGARKTYPQIYEVGNIVKRTDGGFIAAMESGLTLLDDNLSNIEIFDKPEEKLPNNRFNDGKCDRRGRFWAGSLDRGEVLPAGSLYCVGSDNNVSKVLSELVIPNGMGWSLDNKTMYFTDSGKCTIYAFDFDLQTAKIENRREFIVVDPEHGVPDGLCVDAKGFVWSAHWGGSCVTRYDPDGKVERVVAMPVPLVTSLAFGGAKLDQLFITSARYGMSDTELAEAPLSGGLFVFEPGVLGLPDVPYNQGA
ncbi:MAG: SMP-30/gluconolactonase/LRE family protein [Rhodospirillales bacterium]|nr:SMP-30/gluconolactonase/LRE family protein [Rhodospirillales bacterium]